MSEISASLRARREPSPVGTSASSEAARPTAQEAAHRHDRWSIVIPFYNEAPVIGATLASICRQTRPFRLILVDNGSDDGGADVCRKVLDRAGADYRILDESRAGQVHALACGIAAVETEFVAIMDADVHYPAHYLEVAEALFDGRGEETVATSAYFVPPDATPLRAALAAAHQLLAAKLLPKQNHTGGAGHCFRTEVLREAGGYSPDRWRFVLKDHELMHRILKHGRQALSRRLWCAPSERRGDRRRVRWTLAERLAYHFTPFALKDRYFHRWLGPRFDRRGLGDVVLRDRTTVPEAS